MSDFVKLHCNFLWTCCTLIVLSVQSTSDEPRKLPFMTRQERNKVAYYKFGNLADSDSSDGSRRHRKKKKLSHFGKALKIAKPARRESKVVMRNYISNERKLKLLAQFDKVRATTTSNMAAAKIVHTTNPSCPVETFLTFHKRRQKIMAPSISVPPPHARGAQ